MISVSGSGYHGAFTFFSDDNVRGTNVITAPYDKTGNSPEQVNDFHITTSQPAWRRKLGAKSSSEVMFVYSLIIRKCNARTND